MAPYSNRFQPSYGLNPRINQFQFDPFTPLVNRKSPSTNMFGQNLDMSGQTNTSINSAPPPDPYALDPMPDFAGEYKRVTSNRPARLAYQEAAMAGPPEIKRSGWARLGASLAAVGANMGGVAPDKAAAFGIGAYKRPQEEADADYDRKIKEYESLARMENEDVNSQLADINARREDYYNRQNLKLNVAAARRADTEQNRLGKLTDAQIADMQDNAKDRGWSVIKDQDGWSYAVNSRNGDKIRLLKTDKSDSEQLDFLSRELGVREGFDLRKSLRDLYGDLTKIDRTGQWQQAGIEGKSDADRRRYLNGLRSRMNSSSASTIAGKFYADAWEAANNDLVPYDILNYIESNANGELKVMDRPAFAYGWDEGKAEEARRFLAWSLAKNTGRGKDSDYPEFSGIGGGGRTQNSGAPTPGDFSGITGNPDFKAAFGTNDFKSAFTDPNAPKQPVNEPIVGEPFSIPSGRTGGLFPNQPPSAKPKGNFLPGVNVPGLSQAPAPTQTKPVEQEPPGEGESASFSPVPTSEMSVAIKDPEGGVFYTKPEDVDFWNYRLRNPLAGGEPKTTDLPINAGPVNMPGASARLKSSYNVNPNPIQVGAPTGLKPSGRDTPFDVLNAKPKNPISLVPKLENPEADFDSKLNKTIADFKAETGLDLTAISRKRSAAQQAVLYAQGRTAPGKIRTNADGTEKPSKHQSGEAADLRIIGADGKVSEGDEKLWKILGKIANRNGLKWGGDWDKPEEKNTLYDPLHLERR